MVFRVNPACSTCFTPMLRVESLPTDTAPGGNWPEHTGFVGGLTSPGGHVTAVSRRQGQLDVFCVGTDGGVYTSSWSVDGNWAAWTKIGGVTAFAGNYVSAVSRNTDKIDIFVVDFMGGP